MTKDTFAKHVALASAGSCHMHHKEFCVDFETIASTAVDKAETLVLGLDVHLEHKYFQER